MASLPFLEIRFPKAGSNRLFVLLCSQSPESGPFERQLPQCCSLPACKQNARANDEKFSAARRAAVLFRVPCLRTGKHASDAPIISPSSPAQIPPPRK